MVWCIQRGVHGLQAMHALGMVHTTSTTCGMVCTHPQDGVTGHHLHLQHTTLHLGSGVHLDTTISWMSPHPPPAAAAQEQVDVRTPCSHH